MKEWPQIRELLINGAFLDENLASYGGKEHAAEVSAYLVKDLALSLGVRLLVLMMQSPADREFKVRLKSKASKDLHAYNRTELCLELFVEAIPMRTATQPWLESSFETVLESIIQRKMDAKMLEALERLNLVKIKKTPKPKHPKIRINKPKTKSHEETKSEVPPHEGTDIQPKPDDLSEQGPAQA